LCAMQCDYLTKMQFMIRFDGKLNEDPLSNLPYTFPPFIRRRVHFTMQNIIE
jgi:hypothetical protein